MIPPTPRPAGALLFGVHEDLADRLRDQNQGRKVQLQVVSVSEVKGPGRPAEYEVKAIEEAPAR